MLLIKKLLLALNKLLKSNSRPKSSIFGTKPNENKSEPPQVKPSLFGEKSSAPSLFTAKPQNDKTEESEKSAQAPSPFNAFGSSKTQMKENDSAESEAKNEEKKSLFNSAPKKDNTEKKPFVGFGITKPDVSKPAETKPTESKPTEVKPSSFGGNMFGAKKPEPSNPSEAKPEEEKKSPFLVKDSVKPAATEKPEGPKTSLFSTTKPSDPTIKDPNTEKVAAPKINFGAGNCNTYFTKGFQVFYDQQS